MTILIRIKGEWDYQIHIVGILQNRVLYKRQIFKNAHNIHVLQLIVEVYFPLGNEIWFLITNFPYFIIILFLYKIALKIQPRRYISERDLV